MNEPETDDLLRLVPAIVRPWIRIRRIRLREFGIACERDDGPAAYVFEKPAWDHEPGPDRTFSCRPCFEHFVKYVAPRFNHEG